MGHGSIIPSFIQQFIRLDPSSYQLKMNEFFEKSGVWFLEDLEALNFYSLSNEHQM